MLVILAACGGGGSGDGDDDGAVPDGGADGGGDGGGCAPVTCGDTTCGTTTDDCGQATACDRCRFTGDPITQRYVDAVRLVIGDTIQVGYEDQIAVRGAGWTPETLPQGNLTELAVDGNGVRWALFADAAQIFVGNDASGSWVVENILGGGDGASLAFGPGGTVMVAYGGSGNLVPRGLNLATRSAAGEWTHQSVVAMPSFAPEFIDLAVAGGEPMIAWGDRTEGGLKFSVRSGGSFTTETIDEVLAPFEQHDLSLAIDPQGRPHVAYRQDGAFFREIHHAVRDGGTWTHEPAAVMKHGNRGDVRLAVAPNGDLAIVFVSDQGLGLATHTGGRWFVQPLAHEAHTADLAFDAAGVLHIAHADRRTEVMLVTRAGLYPPDYVATCDEIAATLCAASCTCANAGPGDCCAFEGPSLSTCIGPESHCREVMAWMVCGDAHQDPQEAYTCDAATSMSTCESGVLTMPTGCP